MHLMLIATRSSAFVTKCYQASYTADQNKQYAVSVMEVGFAKVGAACEDFFVIAAQLLRNQLAAGSTLNFGLAAGQSVLLATTPPKATTTDVTFGRVVADKSPAMRVPHALAEGPAVLPSQQSRQVPMVEFVIASHPKNRSDEC